MNETQTESCLFQECDFTGTQLNSSTHDRSAFLNCRFRLTNLFGARFAHCKMTGTTFTDATVTGLIIEAGDWSYTSLQGHNLKNADLRRVDLREGDLSDCLVEGADLRQANLTHANLSGSRLAGADLRGAILEGVDLTQLDLQGVRLDLAGAAFLARSFGAIVDLE